MRISDWSSDVCSSDLMSVAYAKEREQFGQPIGRFQALKHQLAHMALDVEPARALVWYAAYAWDAGLTDTIGRASCRARVCQYEWISVVAVLLKKNHGYIQQTY